MPSLACLALLLVAIGAAVAAEPAPIPLWPGEPGPDAALETSEDRPFRMRTIRWVSKVAWPTITVYAPPADRATGAAVVICPGGGYGGLAMSHEGSEVAAWLNTLGVAGIVLKYRMPRPAQSVGEVPWPVQDAARALRLVRARAGEWNIDPTRVGIMGFSAGGHLASTVATRNDAGDPAASDPVQRQGSRPDFLILAYPVVSFQESVGHSGSRDALLGKGADAALIERYSNERQVDATTPPTFLVHTRDDQVKALNSELFAAALAKAGVAHELALYDTGGHGYGLGVGDGALAGWPARCAAWLEQRKLLQIK